MAGDGSEVWIGQNVQLVIENGEVVELQATRSRYHGAKKDRTATTRLGTALPSAFRIQSTSDVGLRYRDSRHFLR